MKDVIGHQTPHTHHIIKPALMALMLMTSTLSGCISTCSGLDDQKNNATPQPESIFGDYGRWSTPIAKQRQMDILWVLDNSASMCQQQKLKRSELKQFVETLHAKEVDVHIGVTTTHAPASDAKGLIEPTAQEAQLQNTPQPIPSPARHCLIKMDNDGELIEGDFTPLRDALTGALDCLSDQTTRDQFNWSDEQLNCIVNRPTTTCAQELNIPDNNNDDVVDLSDLFPSPKDYRALPKVLKFSDYLNGDGALDTTTLTADFACMSMVGSRGDDYQRGLQVAVKATSPQWTGGTAADVNKDITSPNHGLIRRDSGFALIFITNQNDCSSPDEAIPFDNACGADACDYYNSNTISADQSPLYKVEDLSSSFRDSLEETKGRPLLGDDLFVASIHGDAMRVSEPPPSNETCTERGADGRDNQLTVCNSGSGKARSGDRYERFMRQFSRYTPNAKTAEDPKDFTKHEVGYACKSQDAYTEVLQPFAEAIASADTFCVNEPIVTCDQATPTCDKPLSPDLNAQCVAHPDAQLPSLCTNQIGLELVLSNPATAQHSDIAQNPYCLPGSINQLGTSQPHCLVDPSRYTWTTCSTARGLDFEWIDPEGVVVQELSGHLLRIIYTRTTPVQ